LKRRLKRNPKLKYMGVRDGVILVKININFREYRSGKPEKLATLGTQD
jgi:hypothetical protein